jgi:hypothetical protein
MVAPVLLGRWDYRPSMGLVDFSVLSFSSLFFSPS